MGPEEGVPAVAAKMFAVVERMVKVYDAPDVFTVRFEDFTRSSKDFDAELSRLFDFAFGDAITPAARKLIDRAARCEDLKRFARESIEMRAGQRTGQREEICERGDDKQYSPFVHTNRKEDMQLARERGVPLIPQQFFQKYREFQHRLGYNVSGQ